MPSLPVFCNRQGRRTARGDRFTANKVGNLRRYWKIPRFKTTEAPCNGELVTIKKAADILGVAASTVHRWLADGFIAGEQITPGAPWRIRMTDSLRARFVEKAPDGYVTMKDAKSVLGVSPSNGVATCKVWKAFCRTCSPRKTNRIVYQGNRQSTQPVLKPFMKGGVLWQGLQISTNVCIQHPAYLSRHDPRIQSVERVVRTTPRAENHTKNRENPTHKSRSIPPPWPSWTILSSSVVTPNGR